MALSFELMGSWAMCCAQKEQIDLDRVVVMDKATKKANDLHVKVKKAYTLFELFKSV